MAEAALRSPTPERIAKGDLVRIEGDTYESARYEVLELKGDKAYLVHARSGTTGWVALSELRKAEQTKAQYLAEVRGKLAGDSAC